MVEAYKLHTRTVELKGLSSYEDNYTEIIFPNEGIVVTNDGNGGRVSTEIPDAITELIREMKEKNLPELGYNIPEVGTRKTLVRIDEETAKEVLDVARRVQQKQEDKKTLDSVFSELS